MPNPMKHLNLKKGKENEDAREIYRECLFRLHMCEIPLLKYHTDGEDNGYCRISDILKMVG